ncbi:hypothetical protein PTTG_10060 [Puccinia triticina 1-1 BBBD Race 1]|uniref:Uncharacterized protein n=1 Tax=Puccinia triticina (isolate 1-1 / race 1 (BBBD)) TaxID=630390 RepID=A0A180G769_PUCT1|nr:hypothetical protein PTTG_10060 [Puccinia triticina 1-1 BBBD Race 1]
MGRPMRRAESQASKQPWEPTKTPKYPPPATTSNHQQQRPAMEREQIFIDPFKGPSAVLFIKAFTLWRIYPEILFLAGWATLLVLLDAHVPALSLRLPPTILTVLGTVIGFVLSYRTSSAYERYTEGRKQWSTIVHVSRTLACLVWSHVSHPLRLPTPSAPATATETLRGILEKKTFINLIEGFAVSLKHYLRGEHGIYYEDLYRECAPAAGPAETRMLTSPSPDLACYLPKYDFPASLPMDRPDLTLAEPHGPPPDPALAHRPLTPPSTSTRPASRKRPGPRPSRPPQAAAKLNPPEEKLVPLANSLLLSVSSFSDSLATLERILTTPIPFGYIVHLRLIIWGYLVFMPFQLLSTFGYVTIPATALIAIAFLGFLRIGEEIENPFGYDSNDLDMDHFCQNLIGRELAEITGTAAPDPEAFVFSAFNVPLFRQNERRSAAQLAAGLASAADVQRLLRTRPGAGNAPAGDPDGDGCC